MSTHLFILAQVICLTLKLNGFHFKQKSLSSYVKRYAGKNAKTEDLWSVLTEESGVKVNSLMDAWTKQKGYPVISVKAKDHVLEFEQVTYIYALCDLLTIFHFSS